uniref:Mannosyltransferase n=1 Tax=Acrobeloides nanus TaxID=290746 RepID=A0A914EH62_9BILA
MPKVPKNLSLLKRSSNRQSNRPPPTSVAPTHSEEDDMQQISLKDKRATERKAQKDAGACFWENLGGKLFYPSLYFDNEWRLSLTTIFKISFSIRVTASFWSIISDCDEVYNYWEPLHLFLFGRGFQTWEYSPIYAIRSYFYVYLHYIPAQLLFPLLYTSKAGFFHMIRCVIGVFNLASEIVLYESVFGNPVHCH